MADSSIDVHGLRIALADHMTATLADLADAEPEEADEVHSQMANAVDLLLEGLDVVVVGVVDGKLVLHVTIG